MEVEFTFSENRPVPLGPRLRDSPGEQGVDVRILEPFRTVREPRTNSAILKAWPSAKQKAVMKYQISMGRFRHFRPSSAIVSGSIVDGCPPVKYAPQHFDHVIAEDSSLTPSGQENHADRRILAGGALCVKHRWHRPNPYRLPVGKSMSAWTPLPRPLYHPPSDGSPYPGCRLLSSRPSRPESRLQPGRSDPKRSRTATIPRNRLPSFGRFSTKK